MTMTTRTMTNAQMCWNLKNKFAWFGLNSDGEKADDTFDAIYTKDGAWYWSPMNGEHNGRYELN